MTNEELKLKYIEEKLDFIIYLLGYVDLGDITKEEAEHFNYLFRNSKDRYSRRKEMNEASEQLRGLSQKINDILTLWPALESEINLFNNKK